MKEEEKHVKLLQTDRERIQKTGDQKSSFKPSFQVN